MGILLQPNTETIKVHGTDIELTSVYARIEFVAHSDGSTISVTYKTYLDHAHFLTGDCVHTSIHEMPFEFAILSTEEQSLLVALNYTKDRFIEMGYSASII